MVVIEVKTGTNVVLRRTLYSGRSSDAWISELHDSEVACSPDNFPVVGYSASSADRTLLGRSQNRLFDMLGSVIHSGRRYRFAEIASDDFKANAEGFRFQLRELKRFKFVFGGQDLDQSPDR
jgi:hypothetical protein